MANIAYLNIFYMTFDERIMDAKEDMINKGPNKITSIRDAAHFRWGDNYDGWWLKQHGSFNVIEELMPPGASEVAHLHRNTEQFFYCLGGVLNIESGDEQHVLHKNESFCITAGLAHKVFNQSAQPVRFLVVSCPALHDDRIDLIEKENGV